MVKAETILAYLLSCPAVKELYFQYAGDAHDGTQAISTSVIDRARNNGYIDGSVPREADFVFTWFKELSSLPVLTDPQFSETEKNAADLDDVSAIIDWINHQNHAGNVPDLGPNCVTDSIYCLSDTAKLDGVDLNGPRPLGRYRFTIRIEYVDYTFAI